MKSRVLVVDDEPQFLRALSTNLRGAGYEVDTATTAAEALTAAGLRPPDAVVLDLLLPDGSGTDVCRALRTWSDAPIILVSAVGDEDEKIAALDAGADDYVTKPFSAGELLARLRAALRRAGTPGEPVLTVGSITVDLAKDEVTVDGRTRPSDAERIAHPGPACTQPRQAADAPHDLAGSLGAGVWRRVELPARVRLAAATQARAGSVSSSAPDHRARRGLPARGRLLRRS